MRCRLKEPDRTPSYLGLLAVLLILMSGVTDAGVLGKVENEQAPGIKLVDLSDDMHDLANYRGKVVFVNFWATWCPPCLKELPSMQALWDQFKDKDFVMLAVNVGEEHDTVIRFLGSFAVELDFPLLLDSNMSVVRSWPVVGLPTTFIVDKSGRLAYKAMGERDWAGDDVVKIVEELLEGG